jgi:hypothetical protein
LGAAYPNTLPRWVTLRCTQPTKMDFMEFSFLRRPKQNGMLSKEHPAIARETIPAQRPPISHRSEDT